MPVVNNRVSSQPSSHKKGEDSFSPVLSVRSEQAFGSKLQNTVSYYIKPLTFHT
jgi:hypothetical protein